MFQIAICDGEKRQQQELLDFIARDTEIEDDYITECFSDGSHILDRIQKGDFHFDLIFLEIELAGSTGLAVASAIRERKLNTDILFLTRCSDHIEDGFRFRAFNYLIKPLSYGRFCQVMKEYLAEKREMQNDSILISVQGKEYRILLNTVLYFSSEKRKVGIFSLNEGQNLWFYEKLDVLTKKLQPYGFWRCHQSYLVNSGKIKSISREQIEVGKELVPIGRKYSASIKEKWKAYKKMQIFGKRDAGRGVEGAVDAVGKTEVSTIIVTEDDTKSIQSALSHYGAVTGISGNSYGNIYRVYHDEEVLIGRDRNQCQIIISHSTVSRIHCRVRYDAENQCYKIFDCSSNGTFLLNGERFEKNVWVSVARDSVIRFSKSDQLFLLD